VGAAGDLPWAHPVSDWWGLRTGGVRGGVVGGGNAGGFGGAAFVFAGAVRFGRWWTIRFDQAAQRVEYRIGSLIGIRWGEIDFARIAGVVTRTLRVRLRGNLRRPRRALPFLLDDGSVFQITEIFGGAAGGG